MNTLTKTLEHALGTKRASGTFGEAKYTAEIVKQLGDKLTAIDEAGNIYADLRDGRSRTIFTGHIDTCARSEGANLFTKDATHYRAPSDDVLGADNACSVALMFHLIEAGVPGMYIWTRMEEVGGAGGEYIAKNFPDLLREFDRAVTFDRAGTDEVIMRMCVGETASVEFAQAVSDALNDQNNNFMYSPSDRGSFTDVANWIAQIPECVNIGVGYRNQHSERETLDIAHFNALAQAITLVDWEALPVCRKPVARRAATTWMTPRAALHDSDEYDFQGDYEDAIYAAEAGSPQALLGMVAEWAWPEDPAAALKTMSARRLTADVLTYIAYCDADTGLETAYEALAIQ